MNQPLIVLLLACTSCASGSSKPVVPATASTATPETDLVTVETAAYDKAKPVFEKYCAKCHSQNGAEQRASTREHFDMTTYPFGGHHAMNVHEEIRIVLGLTGKKPTMPADKKGAVTGEELELIKSWADAFEASHQGAAHGHEH